MLIEESNEANVLFVQDRCDFCVQRRDDIESNVSAQ
jgi:hypothetical protein